MAETRPYVNATASGQPGEIARAFQVESPHEMIAELLDNARRADATRITVRINETNGTVEVEDDGHGIDDPAVLLSYGRNDWRDGAVKDRELPAGMGFAMLSGQKVQVRSKPAPGLGHPSFKEWKTTLEPDHFEGRKTAWIEMTADTEGPVGTTITISTPGADEWRTAARTAARYFPVPVQIEGTPTPQSDFHAGALSTKEWEGVKISVFHDQEKDRPPVSVFGRWASDCMAVVDPLQEYLPERERNHSWTAGIEVGHCSEIRLQPPERTTVIENAFVRRLREETLRCIYDTMRATGVRIPLGLEDRREAAAIGAQLPQPAEVLLEWRPVAARDEWPPARWRQPKVRARAKHVLLYANDLPILQQHALYRALRRNGLDDSVMQGDKNLEQQDWYDRLTRITSVEVLADGADPSATPQGEHRQVHEITFRLMTERVDGTTNVVTVPADLAFGRETPDEEERTAVLTTAYTELDANRLAALFTDALGDRHRFPEDEEEENERRQRRKYAEAARKVFSW